MAIAVRCRFPLRLFLNVSWITIALGGCSINLGALSAPDREEPVQLTTSTSIAALTDAIKRAPDDPQAYDRRGKALAQAGRTDDALADFNKAISLDPNDAQAYADRGSLYRQLRRLDDAMADHEH